MFPGEQPLHTSEQKAISRAARLSAKSNGHSSGQPDRDSNANQAYSPSPHRRIALGKPPRALGAVTLEQRLVTLFTD